MSDTRRVVVVHDAAGNIRQVVKCSAQNADKQHLAWPGHTSLDVTETCPDAHPHKHSVDIAGKKLIERIVPFDELASSKAAALRQATNHALTSGFVFEGRTYPSNEKDQLNMQHAAIVGGALWSWDGHNPKSWAMQNYEPAAAAKILTAFQAYSSAIRGSFAAAQAALGDATTADQVNKVALTHNPH